MAEKKTIFLQLLISQLLRFWGLIFLPFLLIIAILYTVNYYGAIMLFGWSTELQFQVDYVLVVIGLLIIGGMVGFAIVHLLLGISFLCGIPCLNSLGANNDSQLNPPYLPSKVFFIDHIIACIFMGFVEIPFWLYYHSTTFLATNLISTYLITIYSLVCWRDNVYRKLNSKDRSSAKNVVSIRPISSHVFKLWILLIIVYLIVEIYVTWVDTLTYFNSLD